jgi:Protein of unknown function (DUF2934)
MPRAATPRSTRKRTAQPVETRIPAAPENIAPVNGEPSEDEVRVRAYHKYLERGATDGHDLKDWVEAEKELRLNRRS